MAKRIGIVACSSEGAALCYQTICLGAAPLMGEYNHPEVLMHTIPFLRYKECVEAWDWAKVAKLMLSSARRLAHAGADFLICPDNTIHQAFDMVAEKSPLPWLHIAEVVRSKAQEKGLKRLAVLGTEFLMNGPVYRDILKKSGIETEIPNAPDQKLINKIILNELVYGVYSSESREYFISVIGGMKALGCDGVILGCTEIPKLMHPGESPLPLLDSTRLLAGAAVEEALR